MFLGKSYFLVGGFNPSEKNGFVRLDHHPNYWGFNKIHVPNHQSVIIPVVTMENHHAING